MEVKAEVCQLTVVLPFNEQDGGEHSSLKELGVAQVPCVTNVEPVKEGLPDGSARLGGHEAVGNDDSGDALRP